MQLITGTISPFFSCPYPSFAKWTKWNWISSIWKYTHQLKIEVEIESMWTPSLMRQHGPLLMELARQLNLPPAAIKATNKCLIFLEVITVVDIAMADGNSLLPEAMSGEDLPFCTSHLHWPRQDYTTKSMRSHWKIFLGHIHRNGHLNHPLGQWTSPPRQQWNWDTHAPDPIVYYHHFDMNLWVKYSPATLPIHCRYCTRYQRHW
jgi:hypothetical protein